MAMDTIGIVSNIEGQPYKDIKRIWAWLEREHNCVAYQAYSHPHLSFQAATTSDIRQLKRDMSMLTSRIKPFEIEVGGLLHFDKKVICLKIRKTRELVKIHTLVNQFLEARCRDLFDYYVPDNWIPHVTLAQEVPTAGSFDKAWRELRESKIRFRQRLNNICMVKWYPNGKIKIHSRYSL
jgi:2'-5' RNA ligase